MSNNVITPDSLNKPVALNTVTTPAQDYSHASIPGNVTNSIANEYTNLQTQYNNQQNAQQTNANDQISLMDMLSGRTKDTQVAQENAGVTTEKANLDKYTQQLADLNSQASSLNREAQAIPLQIQQNATGTGATDRGVAPQEAGALRLNAIKALSLGQQADIASANFTGSQIRLQSAKDKAQQIVDLKYKPMEDRIATLQRQYELNKDTLTGIDKKRTEALQVSLKREADKLAEDKKNETDIQNMLVNASSQGAPSSLVTRARTAKTPADASMILGQYAGDYWGMKTKIAQYNKILAETDKTNQETRLGGAVTTSGVAGNSPAHSWLTQYNSGAMSLEDIYSKIGSSKTAESTKNQLSQLIANQGGKRVIPMDDAQITAINQQIKNIDDLTTADKLGYNGKVISGPTQGGAFGFGARITGAKGDALAIARNLISNQTLQSLADAKAKGITFGALSEAELNAVANAASRVASKVIKENDQIVGFSGSEDGFKNDLLDIRKGLVASIAKKTSAHLTGVAGQVEKAKQILNNNSVNTTGGYQFKQ